jgi:hypothetical protein
VPVLPVWSSFMTTTHRGHERGRIVRRPNRKMSLDEAAVERRYLYADASLQQAVADRTEALHALAAARVVGTGGSAPRRRLLARRERQPSKATDETPKS